MYGKRVNVIFKERLLNNGGEFGLGVIGKLIMKVVDWVILLYWKAFKYCYSLFIDYEFEEREKVLRESYIIENGKLVHEPEELEELLGGKK